MSFIQLSGDRVKSKRNRIVPVPSYIRRELTKGNDIDYVFTDANRPPNPDYFKTLFRRFKRNSKIDRNITLYSFRHTGAIEIFKRTGSITTLQKAMGHSRHPEKKSNSITDSLAQFSKLFSN
jgi:integrase